MIRIGAVSPPCEATIENNLASCIAAAKHAKAMQCDILCFPEMFLTGTTWMKSQPISRTDPVIEGLRGLAKELQICLLVGFLEEDAVSTHIHSTENPCTVAQGPALFSAEDSAAAQNRSWSSRQDIAFSPKQDNEFSSVHSEEANLRGCSRNTYITHGVFDMDGSARFYRKTHLGESEKATCQSGNKLAVFPLQCGLTIGIQLCVELHFPEVTQTLSLKGAQVIFAPHAVPGTLKKREELWSMLLRTRSYDNRVYMIATNLRGFNHYPGGIMMTAPDGTIGNNSCHEIAQESEVFLTGSETVREVFDSSLESFQKVPISASNTDRGSSGLKEKPSPEILKLDLDDALLSMHPSKITCGQESNFASNSKSFMGNRYYPALRRPELYRI